jgi:hypothetical protein
MGSDTTDSSSGRFRCVPRRILGSVARPCLLANKLEGKTAASVGQVVRVTFGSKALSFAGSELTATSSFTTQSVPQANDRSGVILQIDGTFATRADFRSVPEGIVIETIKVVDNVQKMTAAGQTVDMPNTAKPLFNVGETIKLTCSGNTLNWTEPGLASDVIVSYTRQPR